jgi:hypothetical protein
MVGKVISKKEKIKMKKLGLLVMVAMVALNFCCSRNPLAPEESSSSQKEMGGLEKPIIPLKVWGESPSKWRWSSLGEGTEYQADLFYGRLEMSSPWQVDTTWVFALPDDDEERGTSFCLVRTRQGEKGMGVYPLLTPPPNWFRLEAVYGKPGGAGTWGPLRIIIVGGLYCPAPGARIEYRLEVVDEIHHFGSRIPGLVEDTGWIHTNTAIIPQRLYTGLIYYRNKVRLVFEGTIISESGWSEINKFPGS